MKDIIVSLFDLTGIMANPWYEAGYTCILADLQHTEGWHAYDLEERWIKVGVDLRNGFEIPSEFAGRVAFVSGFPECTNVAVSGARWFIEKGPRALALSLDLFATCKEVGELTEAPYMIENPVSTFSTYCGKPNHTFHPYEYGGYLAPDDRHPTYPDYIAPRDAYPKKTCLWTGNGFVMPEKRPVETPEGYSAQHTKLGGKSLKTKNIRSATPRGFANAVFRANGNPDLRSEDGYFDF